MRIMNTRHQYCEIRDKEIVKGKFTGCLTKIPALRKELIFSLVEKNMSFEEISYGAGVYKILPNDGKICTHCLGKGLV